MRQAGLEKCLQVGITLHKILSSSKIKGLFERRAKGKGKARDLPDWIKKICGECYRTQQ